MMNDRVDHFNIVKYILIRDFCWKIAHKSEN